MVVRLLYFFFPFCCYLKAHDFVAEWFGCVGLFYFLAGFCLFIYFVLSVFLVLSSTVSLA